jgi:hypothetical protein
MVQDSESRNKKGNEENQKNYTKASSHEAIGCLRLVFALKITRENSFQKRALTNWKLGCCH